MDPGFGKPVSVAETREELMAELATRPDVTIERVLAVGRMPDGKLVWLEEGDSKAGFRHIIERHESEFLQKFQILREGIPNLLILALQQGSPVAIQGLDRLVYCFEYEGRICYIAISVKANGEIFGANPVGDKTFRKLMRRQSG